MIAIDADPEFAFESLRIVTVLVVVVVWVVVVAVWVYWFIPSELPLPVKDIDTADPGWLIAAGFDEVPTLLFGSSSAEE